MNDKVVSNDEIIALINVKLLNLQSELFNNDYKIQKSGGLNVEIKKIIRNFSLILSLVFGILVMLRFEMAFVIGLGISIICFAVVSFLISRDDKNNATISKNSVNDGKEALILQDVRKYLNGKIPLNTTIKERLDDLVEEIINNRG